MTGCLIVEIHDHRARSSAAQNTVSKLSAGGKDAAFSLHSNSQLKGPSPYNSHPGEQKEGQDAAKAVAVNGAKTTTNGEAGPNNENASAMGNAAKSGQGLLQETVNVVVLWPTPASLHAEKLYLSSKPVPGNRHPSQSKDGATPTMAHPPTPHGSVPNTPTHSSKKPKMILDSENHYEWEAKVLLATAPPLYLEPVKNFAEAQALLEFLQEGDALISDVKETSKSRKRTHAEMAADEAQAAKEERYMLIADQKDDGAVSLSGLRGSEGQAGAATLPMDRLKVLENIKQQFAEREQKKKEEEAQQAMLRGQEMKLKQEKQQQQEQHRMQQQARREQIQRQQEMQNAQPNAPPPTMPQMNGHVQPGNMMAHAQAPHLQQATQGQHSSPVIRQQTPIMSASSPMINGPMVTSHPMGGVAMAPTASAQGAGSPPRPQSAVSVRSANPAAQAMGRQVSQQGSLHGTPHLMQTPSMGSAAPVTRNLTPAPIGSQGSPVGPMQANTPVMPQRPQMNGQQHPSPEELRMKMQQVNHQLQQRRTQHMSLTSGQMQVPEQQRAAIMSRLANEIAIYTQQLQRLQQQLAAVGGQGGQPMQQNPSQFNSQMHMNGMHQPQAQNHPQMQHSPNPQMVPQQQNMNQGMNVNQLRQMFVTLQQRRNNMLAIVQQTQQQGQPVPQNVQFEIQKVTQHMQRIQQQFQQQGQMQNQMNQMNQMQGQMGPMTPGQQGQPGQGNQQYMQQLQALQRQSMMQQQRAQQQQQGMHMGNMGMQGMQGMPMGMNMNGMNPMMANQPRMG